MQIKFLSRHESASVLPAHLGSGDERGTGRISSRDRSLGSLGVVTGGVGTGSWREDLKPIRTPLPTEACRPSRPSPPCLCLRCLSQIREDRRGPSLPEMLPVLPTHPNKTVGGQLSCRHGSNLPIQTPNKESNWPLSSVLRARLYILGIS